MVRNPLMQALVNAMDVARLRNEHGMSNREAQALLIERRQLLKTAAAGSAAMLSATPLLAAATPEKQPRGGVAPVTPPRIVVVGAGLGGLAAAYELKKAGLTATVYEASERLGGRCWSNVTAFPGQVAENGGELIDTAHRELRGLARELGLVLDDLAAFDTAQGGEITFWIAGARYTWDEQVNDFAACSAQFDADNKAAPFPQTCQQYTPRGWELDHMSITDYISRYVPGGLSSRLGQLLHLLMDASAGVAASKASALDLVEFFAPNGSDERFHIRGGNDQLVKGMAAKLDPAQIRTGHALTALERNADGTYKLCFTAAGQLLNVVADHVVLALPFSILQSSVDYGRAGFDAMKVACIQNFTMGMHSKFQLQFNRRIWREQGYTGLSDNDSGGYQISWEVTRAQAGTAGILTSFTGDKVAVAMNDRPIAQKAEAMLDSLNLVYPGIKPLWNGKALLNYWPGNPWSKGAYSAHPVGSYTAYYGYAGVRQQNCHFAGEHASVLHSGFLNGAVETGQNCARAILADLRGAG
ncbi:flavin monoamine oxidase family protein [Roseateles koreensis]|uniref:Tryptophan 2-monooxygenase n=1 Tax=Roseateles koreensis TaxID=2987526 RepID=A0ABT5KTQ4_9BURK|nr:NAD(P)/FAD-dependent oxidoreductase [Roseateles koreensis]MDC8785825.1 NAD(P)/FAD-dependent oxidoreductase [Roseateles koreensis]